MIRRMECGSARLGKVPDGCVKCIEGSKMVLFVTGRCGWKCDYCPVSLEKKDKDVTYANEGIAYSDEDIIAEAESMEALGTGITGGDPLVNMDRTIHAICLLKERFGKGHHIHLYTATMDPVKAKALENAGLDEIRFHPMESDWASMEDTRLKETIDALNITVGIEVPALPGREDDLVKMIDYAKKAGVDFVNLNELEFSESNWDMMDIHGYSVRDDVSSAVAGSEETAMKVMKRCKGMNIHFCSSSFKDGVQLRRRLIRRAMHISEEYQQVTEDGTIVRGFIKGPREDVEDALKAQKVPKNLYNMTDDGAEVAPWILERMASRMPFKAWLSEEYPTADGLEVERTPLN